MKERFFYFSKRLLMLALLVITYNSAYPQGKFVKALEKASKVARTTTKNAERIGERSYKISEKYNVSSDGVLHRIPSGPSNSGKYASNKIPVEKANRSATHNYSPYRAVPYAASKKIKTTTCPICHGTGVVKNGIPCRYCRGTGYITTLGTSNNTATAYNNSYSNNQKNNNDGKIPWRTICIIVVIISVIGFFIDCLRH